MHQPVPAERYFAGPALPAALACQHNDAPALAAALHTARLSPNAVGAQGMSLLLLAMSNRSLEAVRELLRLGADPNLRTGLGHDPTLVQPVALAAGGDNTKLLELLLEHGGDPNARFGSRPATFCAADADRYDHLRLLLDHGADINATDETGSTLMLRLADLRQYDQVATLIKRGGDVHKADNVGRTIAFDVQSGTPSYSPTDSMAQWHKEVKHLLEARGVHFPVPHPAIAFQAKVRAENAQKRQWQATTEGQHWLGLIAAAEHNPAGGNDAFRHRTAAEAAFQVWRKAQPGWFPSTNGGTSSGPMPLYNIPPTLAQEAASHRREEADAIGPDGLDSARRAELLCPLQ
jgi:hypothetical protein